jgi:hypothetical protein
MGAQSHGEGVTPTRMNLEKFEFEIDQLEISNSRLFYFCCNKLPRAASLLVRAVQEASPAERIRGTGDRDSG